jgi:hypothetical protein
VRERLVFGPSICGQENLRSLDHANRALAATHQHLHLLPFVWGQRDAVVNLTEILDQLVGDRLMSCCLEPIVAFEVLCAPSMARALP